MCIMSNQSQNSLNSGDLKQGLLSETILHGSSCSSNALINAHSIDVVSFLRIITKENLKKLSNIIM